MLNLDMIQQQSSRANPSAKKRRSQRLELSVPVVAYRPRKYGAPFSEATHTLVVNAHGALLSLVTKVALNQTLILKNALGGQEQECRIVFIADKPTGPPEVGIEFQGPANNFWHIAFPPVDWVPIY